MQLSCLPGFLLAAAVSQTLFLVTLPVLSTSWYFANVPRLRFVGAVLTVRTPDVTAIKMAPHLCGVFLHKALGPSPITSRL